MESYEVRELHEWHRPFRFAVHDPYGKIVSKHETDSEAYYYMHKADKLSQHKEKSE